MKKLQIISILLIFGLLSTTTFISCKKDNVETAESNNESNNNNNNTTTECFDIVDLTTYLDNLQTINFINETEGWIVGINSDDVNKSTLVHTTDGGLTWSVMNTDLDIHHAGSVSAPYIQFYNSTDGYMIGKYDVALGGNKLKYTTNKGQTWTVINGSAIGTWDVVAVNSTNAVYIGHNVYGHNNNSVLYQISNSSHEITKTVDLPSSLDFYAKVDMELSEDGTINVPVSRVNINSSLYMARSVDYGTTWTYNEIELDAIYNIDFPSDNTGYVIGDIGLNPTFYKTIDGGITWTKKSLPISFVHHDFFDAENGLGINQDQIYKTTDGGETWTEVTCFSGSEHEPTRGVAFVSPYKWFAIGTRYVSTENKSYSEFYISKE